MKDELGNRTVRVSEIFYSLEGEGPLAGVPTVFVRFFGCNFTCKGFSNPNSIPIIHTGTTDLKKFKPTMGCDSTYSWHPDYKDLAKIYLIEDLVQAILNVLPAPRALFSGKQRMPILSFTGGEPTMHQPVMMELLEHPAMQRFSTVLIETNAALTLRPVFLDALQYWVQDAPLGTSREVFWSCSPKLKNSGEPYRRAIVPHVVVQQRTVESAQYFKFVSDGSSESFEEILYIFRTYSQALFESTGQNLDPMSIYVMPVGATIEQQFEVQRTVAEQCLNYGFNFCARVHCFVFQNEVGT